jgi:hypothetical protein
LNTWNSQSQIYTNVYRIQNGVHSFYENIEGNPERFASMAKFTHLWILENGEWKLLRSLSYDHQTKKKKKRKK